MKPRTLMFALALVALTACHGNTTPHQQDAQASAPQGVKPLGSNALSRLALQHDMETRQELRDSGETFIEPGTPVTITGVCEIARDVPLFQLDWPAHEADPQPDFRRYYRAHLKDNPELAQMREGQQYLVEGRIGTSGATMCYGAYFIEVESFTAID